MCVVAGKAVEPQGKGRCHRVLVALGHKHHTQVEEIGRVLAHFAPAHGEDERLSSCLHGGSPQARKQFATLAATVAHTAQQEQFASDHSAARTLRADCACISGTTTHHAPPCRCLVLYQMPGARYYIGHLRCPGWSMWWVRAVVQHLLRFVQITEQLVPNPILLPNCLWKMMVHRTAEKRPAIFHESTRTERTEQSCRTHRRSQVVATNQDQDNSNTVNSNKSRSRAARAARAASKSDKSTRATLPLLRERSGWDVWLAKEARHRDVGRRD